MTQILRHTTPVAFLVFARMKEHSEMIGKGKETRLRKKGESCKREDDTVLGENSHPCKSHQHGPSRAAPKFVSQELFAVQRTSCYPIEFAVVKHLHFPSEVNLPSLHNFMELHSLDL